MNFVGTRAGEFFALLLVFPQLNMQETHSEGKFPFSMFHFISLIIGTRFLI